MATLTTSANPADEALPALPDIPGYSVISELGSGSTAVVYLAIQQSLGRKVALKIARRSSGDAAVTDSFLREAKIMSQLSHPHIVAVHEVGDAGGWHYIAMEYLGGGNLRQRIRSRGMPAEDALRIIAQITQALDFAHDNGYLHLDIKPGNILFRHDGSAVLTDFGIARAATAAQRATPGAATVVGTPRYMSPEQAKGRPLDRRSDLYAAGIMLFELLTGRVPFDGDDALDIGIKHLKARVPRLPASVAAYQEIVEKMLAKEPAQRYQRGQAFIDALYTVHAATTMRTGDNATAPKPSRRIHVVLLLALLMLVLLMLAAGRANAAQWQADVTPPVREQSFSSQLSAIKTWQMRKSTPDQKATCLTASTMDDRYTDAAFRPQKSHRM